MGKAGANYADQLRAGGMSSVLVLHGGALGDFVLTLHVLACLRSLSPTLRIDVVARSPFARWAAGRGITDHSYPYEGFCIERMFAVREDGSCKSDNQLAAYDLVLNFMSNDAAAPAIGLRRLGARSVISVDPVPAEETLRARRHITEQWMRDLEMGGLTLVDVSPARLRINEDERAAARERLASKCGKPGGPLAIVHPGSGGRAKCAQLESFIGWVNSMRAEGFGVAWMVGPTELDWYGRSWIDHLRASAPLIYEEDLGRAAEWIMGTDRYIGNDAGMTHVAAALGVETVARFGPTDPQVWRPLGPKVTCRTIDTLSV